MKIKSSPVAYLIFVLIIANLAWVLGTVVYTRINLPDGRSVRCVGLWRTNNRKVYFTESAEQAAKGPTKEICRGGNIFSVEIWSASVDQGSQSSMNIVKQFYLRDLHRPGDIVDLSKIPEGSSTDEAVDISKQRRWDR